MKYLPRLERIQNRVKGLPSWNPEDPRLPYRKVFETLLSVLSPEQLEIFRRDVFCDGPHRMQTAVTSAVIDALLDWDGEFPIDTSSLEKKLEFLSKLNP